MNNRAIAAVCALGVLGVSALVTMALMKPTVRLLQLKGCGAQHTVFVDPWEVAAVVADGGSRGIVALRGNAAMIPICERASDAAEKLDRVRRPED